MNSNKVWAWILGIIVVIGIIILVVHAKKTAAPYADTSTNTSDTSALEASEDISTGSVHASATGAAVASALSYEAALKLYASARIQFGEMCNGISSAQTWKNGMDVMLDNRSAQPRTIHLGILGNVSIKAWGFKIVKLYVPTPPTVINVDCDGQQNTVQISLQK